LDEYDEDDIQSVEALDALAEGVLTVGKKINQKGLVLVDPRKSNVDYSSGIGRLTVISIRKSLIQTAEKQYSTKESKTDDIILPAPNTNLFVGALVQGYVAHVDERHGAFIRFLDDMTGLIPKKNGGLGLPLYETIVTRIKVIDDSKRPLRILLETITGSKKEQEKEQEKLPIKPGDKKSKAEITQIDFYEAILDVPDEALTSKKIRVLMHCTMKEAPEKKIKVQKKAKESSAERQMAKGHPFYGMKVGQKLSDLTVVSVRRRKGIVHVNVTDRDMKPRECADKGKTALPFVEQRAELRPGMVMSGVVTGVAAGNKGLYVQVSPFVKGFVPGLELSRDLKILNDMRRHVTIGSRIQCRVMDERQWHENRANCPFSSQHQQSWADRKSKQTENPQLFLSVIACEEETPKFSKPTRGDLVVGLVNKTLSQTLAPSLMLALRGGFVGRCCITELDEAGDWENMPLGNLSESSQSKAKSQNKEDDEEDSMDVDENDEESVEETEAKPSTM
jgi:hypothetical protein